MLIVNTPNSFKIYLRLSQERPEADVLQELQHCRSFCSAVWREAGLKDCIGVSKTRGVEGSLAQIYFALPNDTNTISWLTEQIESPSLFPSLTLCPPLCLSCFSSLHTLHHSFSSHRLHSYATIHWCVALTSVDVVLIACGSAVCQCCNQRTWNLSVYPFSSRRGQCVSQQLCWSQAHKVSFTQAWQPALSITLLSSHSIPSHLISCTCSSLKCTTFLVFHFNKSYEICALKWLSIPGSPTMVWSSYKRDTFALCLAFVTVIYSS